MATTDAGDEERLIPKERLTISKALDADYKPA
jgi:hypothetical protein